MFSCVFPVFCFFPFWATLIHTKNTPKIYLKSPVPVPVPASASVSVFASVISTVYTHLYACLSEFLPACLTVSRSVVVVYLLLACIYLCLSCSIFHWDIRGTFQGWRIKDGERCRVEGSRGLGRVRWLCCPQQMQKQQPSTQAKSIESCWKIIHGTWNWRNNYSSVAFRFLSSLFVVCCMLYAVPGSGVSEFQSFGLAPGFRFGFGYGFVFVFRSGRWPPCKVCYTFHTRQPAVRMGRIMTASELGS